MNHHTPTTPTDRSVAARWTARLGARFCPVSSYFLANYHRLEPPHVKALHPTEVLTIIHLLDFKWDERAPWPTVGTLAERMGLSSRAVRDATKSLEDRGLLRRAQKYDGGPNTYDLRQLFERLESMMDDDDAKAAAEGTPNGEEAAAA